MGQERGERAACFGQRDRDEPGLVGGGPAVVFCGDLNDEPDAATTQIIQGPTGSEIDPRSGSAFQRPDRGDGYRMWNLAPLLRINRTAHHRSREGSKAAAS